MFLRFDPAARRVLRSAEQASRNHNHYYIGVGHLLLALLEENDSAIGARLDTLSVSRDELAETMRRALGTGDDRMWDGILITPRVRSAIRHAESGAGDGRVEPLGLFDALLADDGGLVADVMASLRGRLREGETAWNT